ncbi:MAG: hypothetical protein LBF61_06805 [Azoarcus sp.]|nr:hypothetical protein [Azoarcus sp.]
MSRTGWKLNGDRFAARQAYHSPGLPAALPGGASDWADDEFHRDGLLEDAGRL